MYKHITLGDTHGELMIKISIYGAEKTEMFNCGKYTREYLLDSISGLVKGSKTRRTFTFNAFGMKPKSVEAVIKDIKYKKVCACQCPTSAKVYLTEIDD